MKKIIFLFLIVSVVYAEPPVRDPCFKGLAKNLDKEIIKNTQEHQKIIQEYQKIDKMIGESKKDLTNFKPTEKDEKAIPQGIKALTDPLKKNPETSRFELLKQISDVIDVKHTASSQDNASLNYLESMRKRQALLNVDIADIYANSAVVQTKAMDEWGDHKKRMERILKSNSLAQRFMDRDELLLNIAQQMNEINRLEAMILQIKSTSSKARVIYALTKEERQAEKDKWKKYEGKGN